jgi:hypothetical protein
MIKALALLILILIANALIADAKCVSKEYELRGTVADTKEQNVQNAKIKIEWIEVKEFKKIATGASDKTGKFLLRFMYYPWSKTVLGGDVCDAELTAINLTVSAKGYEVYKSIVILNGRQSSINIRLHRDTRKGFR